MRHQTRHRIGALAVIALSFTGCEWEGPDDSSVLHRGNGGYPQSLDPLLAEDVHAFRVLADIYEGLVVVDAAGNIAPGVAESWTVSDDLRTWRFELRPDARWSDGQPVTAEDFVRSFRRLATDEVNSAYEFLLSPIVNFDRINRNEAPIGSLGVRAVDPTILEIELMEPTPYWLSVLSMSIAMPKPAGDRAASNGAYVLADARSNDLIRLRRNPEYWDRNSVAIEEVVYHPITNPATEFNLFQTRELDITATVPTSAVQKLVREKSQEIRIAPTLGLYYLAFDLTEPPFDDKRVRQALTMAIDRNKVADLIGRGEKPAFGVVSDGVQDYTPARFDWAARPIDDLRAQANQLLADAGYSRSSPLTINFIYDVGDIHERVALIVLGMWSTLDAVAVNLEKREWKYFLATRDQRDEWDVMRFSWIGDYNDPTTFLEIFRSDSPQNLPAYANPTYDEQLSKAESLSAATRYEQLHRAEQTLIDDYAVSPLYFYVSKHLVGTNVVGFEDNVLDRHMSKYLRIVDRQ